MCFFCFFKQKTAYEMRSSDWSSDVCSSDLRNIPHYRANDRHGQNEPDHRPVIGQHQYGQRSEHQIEARFPWQCPQNAIDGDGISVAPPPWQMIAGSLEPELVGYEFLSLSIEIDVRTLIEYIFGKTYKTNRNTKTSHKPI